MTFFTKYGPAPCDKKPCSEHQTLFHFSGGFGNETRLRTGSKWTTRNCDGFKFSPRILPGPWSLELLLLLSTLFLSPSGGGRGGRVAGFWGGWGTGLRLLA